MNQMWLSMRVALWLARGLKPSGNLITGLPALSFPVLMSISRTSL
jgi:hypothetical protein